MSNNRYSAYRVMWIFVFFDLPTETKAERKAASDFRKELLKDGFVMFQFSIYIRHCHSRENSKVHVKRVREILPRYGKVSLIEITDKQFGMMEIFYGRKKKVKQKTPNQLEMF